MPQENYPPKSSSPPSPSETGHDASRAVTETILMIESSSSSPPSPSQSSGGGASRAVTKAIELTMEPSSSSPQSPSKSSGGGGTSARGVCVTEIEEDSDDQPSHISSTTTTTIGFESSGGEINDAPIEQVRLTVPITDDHTLPALTFRALVIGLICCIIQALTTAFFLLRKDRPSIPSILFEVLILSLGKLMEKKIPKKRVRIPKTKREFSLNPGPFNQKEHALASIMCDFGRIVPRSLGVLTILKAHYQKSFSLLEAVMLSLSTMLLGCGFAGFFLKFLVDSPLVSWYSNLVDVSLYRTLHEMDPTPSGQLTKLQAFAVAFFFSFGYYILPGYFFPSVSCLSIVCFIWKHSITAHQLGSGYNGLGIGSVSLDWLTILSGEDPLLAPPHITHNKMIGFIIFCAITSYSYFTNSYKAKKFPIYSKKSFDSQGKPYNISRIVNSTTLKFDPEAYYNYSMMYITSSQIAYYGLMFAALSAMCVYIPLYHGKDIWKFMTGADGGQIRGDVHNRLMKNYKAIPQWWFYVVLILMIPLGYGSCVLGLGGNLRLPLGLYVIACCIGLLSVFPLAMIYATTTQILPVSLISALVSGYLFPDKGLANLIFNNYAIEIPFRALNCFRVFKIGHYMKLPPRSVFIVMVAGSVVAALVSSTTLWFLLTSIENICSTDEDSPWTCTTYDVFFHASSFWTVIGPRLFFAPDGTYSRTYIYLLFGPIAVFTAWQLSRVFPEKTWIRLIHVPVIFAATLTVVESGLGFMWSWYIVSSIFIYLFTKNKSWWAQYNYVLITALESGASIMALFIHFALPMPPKWWGSDEGGQCPLAHCPTDPSVVVNGCPSYK